MVKNPLLMSKIGSNPHEIIRECIHKFHVSFHDISWIYGYIPWWFHSINSINSIFHFIHFIPVDMDLALQSNQNRFSPGFGWFHQWGINPYLPRGWLENPPLSWMIFPSELKNWTSMTRSGVFQPPLKQSEGNLNISNCWLHRLHISIYSYDIPNKSPFTTYYSHEKFSEKMPAIFIPQFETAYCIPENCITIPVGFWFRSHQIPFFINAYCIPIIHAFFLYCILK
jgi:hypothetical protein